MRSSLIRSIPDIQWSLFDLKAIYIQLYLFANIPFYLN